MGPNTRTLLLALALLPLRQEPGAPAHMESWDARQAEHFWNRAGFGANSAQIERSVADGPERTVDSFLRIEDWIEEPFYARKRADGDLGKLLRALPDEMRDKRMDELKKEDRAQAQDFLEWWAGRMLSGEEPLRERMVLFWHGHFTSSMDAVKSSYEMIQQNQLFRREGLGSFRTLLHAVARDPAMLLYLDNTSNKKAHPNENFARELMELYALGRGNYDEQDVQEVARAFTGWGQSNGRFRLDAKRHDGGKKSVLGVRGKLDGDDVIEILLAQPACARHLAHALLTAFEGLEPSEERLASYAELLRAEDYSLAPFLRRLFLDPGFYAPERIAARVSSPLDFLIGTSRRLGVPASPDLVIHGAALLGQELFHPPSVLGWEGGDTWATGAGLVLRGELVGMLLGRVSGRDLAAHSLEGEDPSPARRARRKLPPQLRELSDFEGRPRVNLTARLQRWGGGDDATLARALAEELLASPAPDDLVEHVRARLAHAREDLALGDAPWTSRPEVAEPLLRELAHGILALPEAQLD